MVTIKDIKTFITCPMSNTSQPINMVVVRVDTNQDGLFGLGCATFTQRSQAVATVIDNYLRPLLLSRDVANINDIWMICHTNAYWRNGPIITTALGGIDLALWDIKGKMAGMPVYQLLGGKCREGIALYQYAFGRNKEEILEDVQRLWKENCSYIRPQLLLPDCAKGTAMRSFDSQATYINPKEYMRKTIEMFEYLRQHMGFQPEFIHDVHEKVLPSEALQFAKEFEPIKMFFVEDLFSPEQSQYLRHARNICTTPIAQGELSVNPNDWLYLVTERLIDFIRIHITMIGGLTAGIKCAHICEAFGVRLAWHGPHDMNPVGHVAQMHLDLASSNFGVQEWPGFDQSVYDLFGGMPEIKDGYAFVNDRPGFGITFDEKLAKKFPYKDTVLRWTQLRRPDGTAVYP